MKATVGYLCLMLTAAGCATGEPSPADRDACIRAGHEPGTEAYETCLQERLARQFERPAGTTVDDLRTRMGPR